MASLPPLEVPELASGNPQLQRAMTKMVRLEQNNLGKVEEKIAKVDGKLNLVKEFKTKFNDLRDAAKPFKSVADFRDLKGDSSAPEILKVGGIDKEKAQPGSYTFEVIELASPSSLMTRGIPDRDKTELGVGYISFKTPEGDEKDVYINSENNTLDGIANAINSSGIGVKATVINDGTDDDAPFRLILAGEKTGWRNDMEWAEFNFLDGDLDLDKDYAKEATSAAIKFNGQPMYVDENKLKDLLPGVTLDLISAKPGQTINVEIKPDTEKVEGKAKNLVDKMNAVLTAIQSQFQLGPDSKNDPTKAMAGDVSLQTLQSQMRTLIQDTASTANEGQIKQLRDVGIVFNRNGNLDYDPKKFQAALDSRFEEVALLFSGSTPLSGFANGLVRVVDNATRTGDGILSLREKGINENKKRLESEMEQKRTRAEKRIERAKSQFGRAEAAMEQLRGMGSAVSTMGAPPAQ
jgi:flagellar hook-associated protein 2